MIQNLLLLFLTTFLINACQYSSTDQELLEKDKLNHPASMLRQNNLINTSFHDNIMANNLMRTTKSEDVGDVGDKSTDGGIKSETLVSADLSNLLTTEGYLDPGFRSDVNNYYIAVRHYPLSFQLIPTSLDPDAQIIVGGLTVRSGNASQNFYLPQGISNIDVVVTASDRSISKTYHLTIYRMSIEAQECREAFDRAGTLEEKLQNCKPLQDQIVWEEGTLDTSGNPVRVPYEHWTRQRKGILEKIYQKLQTGDENLGLNCPMAPQNTIFNYNWDWPIGALYTPSQAFNIYAAHVAHSLYLEINRLVPWSLLEHPEFEFRHFFDSSYMFTQYVNRMNFNNNIVNTPVNPIRSAHFNYDLVGSQYKWRAAQDMVCDPRVGYQFLRGLNSSSSQNLVASTETETLKNLTLWFRDNVKHSSEDRWRSPDHSRAYLYLKDRLKRREDTPLNSKSLESPVGCHTAASLLYDLARSINIPLTIAGYSTQQRADLTVDDRYLRHAGIVYRPDSGQNAMKVLLHIDSIYSLPSADEFFSIDPSTEALNLPPIALNQSAKEQLFFDENWTSLDKLRLYGFVFSGSLNLLERGGRYASSAVGVDDYRTDGVYLGYFPYNTSTSTQDFDSLFELEKRYQLCNYSFYLNEVCATDLVGYQDYFSSFRYSPLLFPIPLASGLTSTDYHNHGRACITAHGGCEAVLTTYIRRLTQQGITPNYWIDVSH